MSGYGILDIRKAHKAHTNDLDDIGKRPNKGFLSMVLNNNDGELWSLHVETHRWWTSKWKTPFRQRGVTVTCSSPIERQRLTNKGEIVEYTHVSEVAHWVMITRMSS